MLAGATMPFRAVVIATSVASTTAQRVEKVCIFDDVLLCSRIRKRDSIHFRVAAEGQGKRVTAVRNREKEKVAAGDKRRRRRQEIQAE